MLEINPQYDGHGHVEDIWVMRVEPLWMGTVLLIIKAALSFLSPFTTKGYGLLKVPPSTMLSLFVDPQPPETVRNKCLLFISYLVFGIS